jgi:hypothetical protein
MSEPQGFLSVGLTLDQKMSQMVREIWKDGYDHGEAVAMASRYTMEQMDDRCEESVESTLKRVLEIVGATRHEDACCSRGCACQTNERPEPCDLLCNCMVGSVVSEILYAVRRAYSTAVEVDRRNESIPEPPAPNAMPAFVNRWSGRDAAQEGK